MVSWLSKHIQFLWKLSWH